MTDKKLPDKVIDVIDEAGSQVKMRSLGKGDEFDHFDHDEEDYSDVTVNRTAVISRRSEPATVDVDDVEYIVAKLARIPEKRVSHDDLHMMEHLQDTLKSVVFHQDEAIEELTDAIQLSRAGLRHRKNRSAITCLPVLRVSERPRSCASSRIRWVWSLSGLICPNIWKNIPCHA